MSSRTTIPFAKVTVRESPFSLQSLTKPGTSRRWIAPTSRMASHTTSLGLPIRISLWMEAMLSSFAGGSMSPSMVPVRFDGTAFHQPESANMQQPTDHDAATPRHLRDKYAIVGVGETPYTRGSGRTTRALATLAARNAIEGAGLHPRDVDGMMSYSFGNDSTSSMLVAGDLGIRLNFYMDVSGGGSSTEALVGIAIGVIEAGMCSTVAIFRAMNGYSQ